MLLREGLRYRDESRFDYGYGYFLPWKDHLVPALEEQGAEVTCFGARSVPGLFVALPKVLRAVRHWRADLLHCHLPMTGVVGRLLGRMTGLPVVYTEHNLMERYHPLTRRLNCWTWSWQDAVVAVSEQVRAAALERVGDGVPIHLVRNGVDVETFRPEPSHRSTIRQQLGIPDSSLVVGSVAVFRTQKRLDLWLETAARLREQFGNLHFLLVGDGPLLQDVRGWAQSHGLQDHLHMPGLQEDVLPYYAAMDLYLMSSRFEGLPIALLEAMAMELPVVATRVGGVAEALEEGVSGVLVPAGDAAALVQASAGLLRDVELRRELGKAARARVSSEFSMHRMTQELEAIYSRILEATVR